MDSKEVAVLFAILFVVVGYAAPIIFATYAPSDYYIEINDFDAESINQGESSHTVCLDRDVRDGQAGTLYTELFLIEENTGDRIEIESNVQEEYFEEGDFAVEAETFLPTTLSAGTYKYVIVIQITPAQGRVTRTVEHKSNEFTVYGPNSNGSPEEFTCT